MYAGFSLAVTIVWFAFRDRFRDEYGPDRGPLMLLLFLFCWPGFIIVSLIDLRRRKRDRG